MARRSKGPPFPEEMSMRQHEVTKTLVFQIQRSGKGVLRMNAAACKAVEACKYATPFDFFPEKTQEELRHNEIPGQLTLKQPNGKHYTINFYKHPSSGDVFAEASDVTRLFHKIEELQRAVESHILDRQHDARTGLPTMLYFKEQYQLIRAQTIRSNREKGKGGPKQNLALYFLDLNKFKSVNDTYGHFMADELIAAIGHRFRQLIRRETDVIARYNDKADEFLGFSTVHTEEDAVEFAKLMVKCFTDPFEIRRRKIEVSFSIGIRFVEVDIEPLDLISLAEQAENAMYRSKTGNLPYVLYRRRA